MRTFSLTWCDRFGYKLSDLFWRSLMPSSFAHALLGWLALFFSCQGETLYLLVPVDAVAPCTTCTELAFFLIVF